jgi:catechol-2,3-dioxygenase
MAVTRLNHAVLYVRDLEETVAFWTDVMGFRVIERMDGLRGARFLRAPDSTNDHDLGLFEMGRGAGPTRAGESTVGLYHLAWEVDTLRALAELAEKLSAAGALVGASNHGTTKSLYAKDPNGIEFEVVWIVPADLLTQSDIDACITLTPLDLPREVERFGLETRGGVGISVPA